MCFSISASHEKMGRLKSIEIQKSTKIVDFRGNPLRWDTTVCSDSLQKHSFAKADAVTASASTVEGNDQDQDEGVKEVAALVFPPSGCF